MPSNKNQVAIFFAVAIALALAVGGPITYLIYILAENHPDAFLVLLGGVGFGIIIALVLALNSYLTRKALDQDDKDEYAKAALGLAMRKAHGSQRVNYPMLPFPTQQGQQVEVGQWVDTTEPLEIQ